MKVRRMTVQLLGVLACTALMAGAVSARTGYYNVNNTPFATVSNGPQNLRIADVRNPRDAREVSLQIKRVLGQTSHSRARSREDRFLTFLRSQGLIGPKERLMSDSIVVVRTRNTIIYPKSRTTRAYGSGTLSFTYTAGWDAADLATLKQIQQVALPKITEVYGMPVGTHTIRVTRDDSLSDRDAYLGGVLVEDPVNGPEIRLPHYVSNPKVSLGRSFVHMILHAYHIGAHFSYDAWEEGFVRAAAVVVGTKVDPLLPDGYKLDFMGSSNPALFAPLYYSMSNYEMLNQPALGTNTFLTSWSNQIQDSSSSIGGLVTARCGMASTAWLKVYIEEMFQDTREPMSFFRRFNAAYYNALNVAGNSGLPGNVPKLKEIATSLVPSVEGKSFNDWYRRQYVLNTAISQGRKVYAWAFPESSDDAESRFTIPVFLFYYRTDSLGDETPLNGTCYPVYWNYSYNIDLPVSGQADMAEIVAGMGSVVPIFVTANLGGAQRVTMDFSIDGATQRVYAPVGFSGSTNPNAVQGVVIGGNTGSASITMDTEKETATVANGGFSGNFGGDLGFFRKMNISYSSDAANVNRTANVGPGNYVVFVEAKAVSKTLTKTYPAGYNMISLPLTTYETDHALALGGSSAVPAITSRNLLLSRWNGNGYIAYPNIPAFQSGFGYWARFPVPTTVKVTGEVANPDVNYRIPLVYGWNQIGCPFEMAVPVSNILIEHGSNEPISFADAGMIGLMSRYVWKLASTTSSTPYALTNVLEPWYGYWVHCLTPNGAVLIIPRP